MAQMGTDEAKGGQGASLRARRLLELTQLRFQEILSILFSLSK